MKFYRNLIKDSRVLVIASASGIALFSQQLPTHALEMPFANSRTASSSGQAEPPRLQISNTQIRSMPSVSGGSTIQTQYQQASSAEARAQQLYGGKPQVSSPAEPSVFVQPSARPLTPTPAQPQQQIIQQSTPQIQQPVVVAPTAGTQTTRRSLLDRLVGKVRGNNNIPSGPPQDPGMRYTTVSEAAQQQITQQEPKRFTPPPVPAAGMPIPPLPAGEPAPITPIDPPQIVTSEQSVAPLAPPVSPMMDQPRLFPTADKAAPLNSAVAQQQEVAPLKEMAPQETAPQVPPFAFIPPTPDADEFLSPAEELKEPAAETVAENEPPQNFPELKAIMLGKTQEEPVEPSIQPVSPPPAPSVEEIIPPSPQPQSIAETTPEKQLPKPLPATTPDPLIVKRSKPLPVLDLSAPLPKLEAMLKEAQESESVAVTEPQVGLPATSEIPGSPTDIPSPEIASVPVIPATPVMESAPTANDPLANAFPEDNAATPERDDSLELVMEKSPQTVRGETTTGDVSEDPAATEIASRDTAPDMPTEGNSTNPYTGLSLESDLFLKGKTPAPGEPQEAMVAKTDAESEELPLPSVVASIDPQVTEDETDLPLLPLPQPAKISPEQQPAPERNTAQEDVDATQEKMLTPSKEVPQLQAPQIPLRVAQVTPQKPGKVHLAPVKRDDVKQTKMELIASRKGMTGLKGFCPVMLRDARDLVDAREEYTAVFNEKAYSFSSGEALQAFLAEPEKYAPAIHGSDVIHLSLTGEEIEGSLDHAVWYKGRLYLFTSAETMETFVAAPSSHSTNL